MKTGTSPMEKSGLLPGPTSLSALAVAIISYILLKALGVILLKSLSYELTLWQNALIFAIFSSCLSPLFQLPKWWPVIFSIFSLIFVIIQGHDVPIWIFPTLVFLLIILNWNSFGDRVPLYLSNQKTVESLSLLIDKSIDGKIYDLGCGLGSAIIPLAELHPNKQFIGVETAPLPWLICTIRARIKKLHNLTIRRQSIWDCDITDAALVYVFLSPQPMNKIIKKCYLELKTGASIISNSFDSDENPAPEMIQLYDTRQTKLLIWEIK